jgi:lipoprotein-releasing system permease protein
MDQDGRTLPDQKSIRLPIANQFHSGLYEVDANTVLVRLDVLQRLLNMNEAMRLADERGPARVVRRTNPETGQEEFVEPQNLIREPARVTNVLVRGKDGVEADRLKARVQEIYRVFAADHAGDVLPPPAAIRIRTWRDQNKTLISAVEKETGLVLFIFGIIALTSVFLVLAIFWAMVSEKTKDIGILRAIGASRGGVAWIWLRYGLVIGVVGALAGAGVAYLIVTNINPIHEWLGRQLGLVIWDPQVYYFTIIPNRVDPTKAALVMIFGVAASVAGALVPALKAAYMDPVRALRFE